MSVETDFRALVGDVPGTTLVLDSDLTILWATPEYFVMTLTDPSIVGRHVFDVFPPEPAPGGKTLAKSFERVLREGVPDEMPEILYPIKRPSGDMEDRWWKVVNTPVLEDGKVAYIINRVVDVTYRHRLNEVTNGNPKTSRQSWLVGALFATLLGVVIAQFGLDGLRAVVIIQGFIVFGLYAASLVGNLSYLRGDPYRSMRIGGVWRGLGILVLLGDSVFLVFGRLGSTMLSPLTPILQVALIALVIAWQKNERLSLVDRRTLRATMKAAAVEEAVEDLQEARYER